MRDRVALERLQAALAREADHALVEVDTVRADPIVAHELEEHRASARDVEHPFPAAVELEEPFRLLTDHAFGTTEARLEVPRVHVRRDLVLATALEFALEPLEPLAEPRRQPS